jgi:ABC-type glycerol-3-phosphate transport system permease component
MRTKKVRLSKILLYSAVIVVCAAAVLPFLWMVSSSFKTRSEIFTYPPVWIPRSPTLANYAHLTANNIFGKSGFAQFARNSLIVASATALLTMTIASAAAYSLSRFRFTAGSLLRYTILLSQMLPGALLLVPLYLFFKDVQLLNTLSSLILVYTAVTLPYCTYILKGYFDTIPPDLDEAALVDGCSRMGALFLVVFPVAAPGIVVTTLSAFILGWNEYMFAMVFTNSYDRWTLPVALGAFQGQYLVEWGFIFAGATLVTIPVVVLFLVLQRWLAAGFVSGAVKG